MTNFWSLMKESVITQSVLTIMIWGCIIFMLATDKVVPTNLWVAGAIVMGFFFGAKTKAGGLTSADLETIATTVQKGMVSNG